MGGLTTIQVEDYQNNAGSNQTLSELDPPDYPCPPGSEWKMIPDFDDPAVDFIWVCVPTTPPPPPAENECGCVIPSNDRKPAGCVRVDNDGVMEGVQIATIKVKGSWFGSDFTTTDAVGCWSLNKGYSSRIWVSVKFKNNNVKVKDKRFWGGIRAVKHKVGKFKNPPYNDIYVEYGNHQNDNESRGRMFWAAAHTLNTVNNYRMQAAADGIPLPRTGLNWLNKSGEGPASAAMLQGHIFSSWPAFLALYVAPIPYLYAIPFLPQGLMWDLGDDTPFTVDNIEDPNTGVIEEDNVSGFTRNMIFNGLSPNVNNIRDFRDRLRILHLSDTPNNITDYNALLDIYDVFN